MPNNSQFEHTWRVKGVGVYIHWCIGGWFTTYNIYMCSKGRTLGIFFCLYVKRVWLKGRQKWKKAIYEILVCEGRGRCGSGGCVVFPLSLSFSHSLFSLLWYISILFVSVTHFPCSSLNPICTQCLNVWLRLLMHKTKCDISLYMFKLFNKSAV